MGDRPFVTRREFTLEGAMTLLAGVAITVSGCGGGGGGGGGTAPTAPSPSPQPGSEVGSVSANHGHTAVISAAQLMAGNAITLDIRGSATHPHTVQLTQADLQQIAADQRVTKTSSDDDGHTHQVTFN